MYHVKFNNFVNALKREIKQSKDKYLLLDKDDEKRKLP